MVFSFKTDLDEENREFLINVINSHGIYDHEKTYGRGTFAVVYLHKGKIHRFSHMELTEKAAEKKLYQYREIAKRAEKYGLGPKMYDIQMIRMNKRSNQYVLISIQEELKRIEWTEWKKVYEREEDLIEDCLSLYDKMKEGKIAHRDISHNNSILTKKGIYLIDWDDGCVENLDCKNYVIGTPGYVSPEQLKQESGWKGEAGVKLRRFYRSEYGIKRLTCLNIKNNIESLHKYALFALTMVCYYALTGIDVGYSDYEYDLSEIKKRIRWIFHGLLQPCPEDRLKFYSEFKDEDRIYLKK